MKTLDQFQSLEAKELTLSVEECAAVLKLVMQVQAEYGSENFQQFYHTCWRSAGRLPLRVTRALADFRSGRSAGHLLIRGLPMPLRLPATPSAMGMNWNPATLHARKMLCVLLSSLGHIYNFAKKKHLDFIDDIFPIHSTRFEQLGTNQCFLEWHVEDGFHPAKADMVSLFCLRGDAEAVTYLCHAHELAIAPEHRQQLEQANFLIEVDPTFVSGSQSIEAKPCAVLSGGQDPEFTYDPAYMKATTPAAELAMAHLKDCIVRVQREINLEPGDFLVFDNRRTIHARSAYRPRFDGTDRWLLRGMVLESYWKAREHLHDLAYDMPSHIP